MATKQTSSIGTSTNSVVPLQYQIPRKAPLVPNQSKQTQSSFNKSKHKKQTAQIIPILRSTASHRKLMSQTKRDEDDPEAIDQTYEGESQDRVEEDEQERTPAASQTKLYMLKSGNISMKRKYDQSTTTLEDPLNRSVRQSWKSLAQRHSSLANSKRIVTQQISSTKNSQKQLHLRNSSYNHDFSHTKPPSEPQIQSSGKCDDTEQLNINSTDNLISLLGSYKDRQAPSTAEQLTIQTLVQKTPSVKKQVASDFATAVVGFNTDYNDQLINQQQQQSVTKAGQKNSTSVLDPATHKQLSASSKSNESLYKKEKAQSLQPMAPFQQTTQLSSSKHRRAVIKTQSSAEQPKHQHLRQSSQDKDSKHRSLMRQKLLSMAQRQIETELEIRRSQTFMQQASLMSSQHNESTSRDQAQSQQYLSEIPRRQSIDSHFQDHSTLLESSNNNTDGVLNKTLMWQDRPNRWHKKMRDREVVADYQQRYLEVEMDTKGRIKDQKTMGPFYEKYIKKMGQQFVKDRVKRLKQTFDVAKAGQLGPSRFRSSLSQSIDSQQQQSTTSQDHNSQILLPNSQRPDYNSSYIQHQDGEETTEQTEDERSPSQPPDIRNSQLQIKNFQTSAMIFSGGAKVNSPLVRMSGFDLRQRLGQGDRTIDQIISINPHNTSSFLPRRADSRMQASNTKSIEHFTSAALQEKSMLSNNSVQTIEGIKSTQQLREFNHNKDMSHNIQVNLPTNQRGGKNSATSQNITLKDPHNDSKSHVVDMKRGSINSQDTGFASSRKQSLVQPQNPMVSIIGTQKSQSIALHDKSLYSSGNCSPRNYYQQENQKHKPTVAMLNISQIKRKSVLKKRNNQDLKEFQTPNTKELATVNKRAQHKWQQREALNKSHASKNYKIGTHRNALQKHVWKVPTVKSDTGQQLVDQTMSDMYGDDHQQKKLGYLQKKKEKLAPIDLAVLKQKAFQQFDLIIDAEKDIQRQIRTQKQIPFGKDVQTPTKDKRFTYTQLNGLKLGKAATNQQSLRANSFDQNAICTDRGRLSQMHNKQVRITRTICKSCHAEHHISQLHNQNNQKTKEQSKPAFKRKPTLKSQMSVEDKQMEEWMRGSYYAKLQTNLLITQDYEMAAGRTRRELSLQYKSDDSAPQKNSSGYRSSEKNSIQRDSSKDNKAVSKQSKKFIRAESTDEYHNNDLGQQVLQMAARFKEEDSSSESQVEKNFCARRIQKMQVKASNSGAVMVLNSNNQSMDGSDIEVNQVLMTGEDSSPQTRLIRNAHETHIIVKEEKMQAQLSSQNLSQTQNAEKQASSLYSFDQKISFLEPEISQKLDEAHDFQKEMVNMEESGQKSSRRGEQKTVYNTSGNVSFKLTQDQLHVVDKKLHNTATASESASKWARQVPVRTEPDIGDTVAKGDDYKKLLFDTNTFNKIKQQMQKPDTSDQVLESNPGSLARSVIEKRRTTQNSRMDQSKSSQLSDTNTQLQKPKYQTTGPQKQLSNLSHLYHSAAIEDSSDYPIQNKPSQDHSAFTIQSVQNQRLLGLSVIPAPDQNINFKTRHNKDGKQSPVATKARFSMPQKQSPVKSRLPKTQQKNTHSAIFVPQANSQLMQSFKNSFQTDDNDSVQQNKESKPQTSGSLGSNQTDDSEFMKGTVSNNYGMTFAPTNEQPFAKNQKNVHKNSDSRKSQVIYQRRSNSSQSAMSQWKSPFQAHVERTQAQKQMLEYMVSCQPSEMHKQSINSSLSPENSARLDYSALQLLQGTKTNSFFHSRKMSRESASKQEKLQSPVINQNGSVQMMQDTSANVTGQVSKNTSAGEAKDNSIKEKFELAPSTPGTVVMKREHTAKMHDSALNESYNDIMVKPGSGSMHSKPVGTSTSNEISEDQQQMQEHSFQRTTTPDLLTVQNPLAIIEQIHSDQHNIISGDQATNMLRNLSTLKKDIKATNTGQRMQITSGLKNHSQNSLITSSFDESLMRGEVTPAAYILAQNRYSPQDTHQMQKANQSGMISEERVGISEEKLMVNQTSADMIMAQRQTSCHDEASKQANERTQIEQPSLVSVNKKLFQQ